MMMQEELAEMREHVFGEVSNRSLVVVVVVVVAVVVVVIVIVLFVYRLIEIVMG